MTDHTELKDVYTRVTDRIIADPEKGVRTWMKPWNAAIGSACRKLLKETLCVIMCKKGG